MEIVRRNATYQDVLDAPEHKVAEIIDGDLYLSPRPAIRHALVGSRLGVELGTRFGRHGGDPGGWMIMDEPELHLGSQICVPDIAGWRRDRQLPEVDGAFATVPPDWLCEVLSPSTEKLDRTRKLKVYAVAGVSHAWLVHPRFRSLEVFRRDGTQWVLVATYRDNEKVTAEPFEAFELDLAELWGDIPNRVSETPDTDSDYGQRLADENG